MWVIRRGSLTTRVHTADTRPASPIRQENKTMPLAYRDMALRVWRTPSMAYSWYELQTWPRRTHLPSILSQLIWDRSTMISTHIWWSRTFFRKLAGGTSTWQITKESVTHIVSVLAGIKDIRITYADVCDLSIYCFEYLHGHVSDTQCRDVTQEDCVRVQLSSQVMWGKRNRSWLCCTQCISLWSRHVIVCFKETTI